MAKRYEAVVIGGAQRPHGRRLPGEAGKQCWCWSAARAGGAAVTEEIFPGFRFSVYSYVVSLLRPEIIRELELPRDGLEILPLDGTITPLEDDYLWRVNDHAKTIRELRRWSLSRRRGYEEYGTADGRDGALHQADPVASSRRIPGRLSPLDWLPLAGLAESFSRPPPSACRPPSSS